MTDSSDTVSLLREFQRSRSDSAFRGLVQNYRGLVFSAAMRQLNGDSHLAEDATQTVFTDLARKADRLRSDENLGGWLHCHTGFVCSDLRRSEGRRRKREEIAASMTLSPTEPSTNWSEVESELDAAINELKETDRLAIVSRFFEKLPLKAMGELLNVSEDAAQKRVARAVDRLRENLGRRGVVVPLVALTTGLRDAGGYGPPTISVAHISNVATSAATGGFLWAWLIKVPLSAKLTLVAALGAIVLMQNFANTESKPGSDVPLSGGQIVRSESSVAAIGQRQIREQSPGATSRSEMTIPDSAEEFWTVQFVDKDTGAAIPNFKLWRLWVGDDDIPRSGDLEADENGEVRLNVPPPGSSVYRVSARTEGWGGRTVSWELNKGEAIPKEYEFQVERAVAIGGLVVDVEGNPVTNASITISTFSYPTTDTNGRWRTASSTLRDLHHREVRVGAGGFLLGEPVQLSDETARVRALAGELVVTLERGLTLTGTVVDERGNPLANARLRTEQGSSGPRNTGTNGAFNLRWVKPGPGYLDITCPGYATRRLKIDFTNNPPPLEIGLNRGRKFTVQLTDFANNPISGVEVRCSSYKVRNLKSVPLLADLPTRTQGSDRAITDLTGYVTFTNVQHQRMYVWARTTDYGPTTAAVDTNQNHVALRFRRQLAIAGSVVDALTKKPIKRFVTKDAMIWEDPNVFPKRWNHRPQAFVDGRFDFTYAVPEFKEQKNLENARYFVRIEAHGYEPFTSDPMKLTADSWQLDAHLVRSETDPSAKP